MALFNTISGQFAPPSNITTMFREAVSETVTIQDPFATPVLDRIEHVSADSTIHQWPVDSLPSLFTSNTAGAIDVDGINTQGLLEAFTPTFGAGVGSPYTPSAAGTPKRLTNVVQIFGAKFGANDSLMRGRASLIGIKDPYAHEQMKASKVIKKAKERRMFEPTNVTALNAGDPRRMASLPKWVDETGAALLQVTANAGSGGNLGAVDIDAAAEAATRAGARPTSLVCGVGTKFDISAALRPASASVYNMANINASEHKLVRNVDYYEVDGLGVVSIFSDFQIPESSATSGGGKAYLLDLEKLAWATYVPLTHIPLAKTGYTTTGILVEEGTYEFRHPSSCVMFNQVTT